MTLLYYFFIFLFPLYNQLSSAENTIAVGYKTKDTDCLKEVLNTADTKDDHAANARRRLGVEATYARFIDKLEAIKNQTGGEQRQELFHRHLLEEVGEKEIRDILVPFVSSLTAVTEDQRSVVQQTPENDLFFQFEKMTEQHGNQRATESINRAIEITSLHSSANAVWLKNLSIDFLNFPTLTSERGQEIIQKLLQHPCVEFAEHSTHFGVLDTNFTSGKNIAIKVYACHVCLYSAVFV